MSGFSTHLAQQVANHFFRGIAQPATGATYLALMMSDPTDANNSATEVTGAWYARQRITAWTAPAEDSDSSWISNTNDIEFSSVTGSAVTSTYYAIYDAPTAGNLMSSGPWTAAKVLNVDDVPMIRAGEAVLKFK